MEKESILGRMVGNMKENIDKIVRKGMVHTHGRMERNTKVNGKKENNMEKENIYFLMVQLKREYGRMEKRLKL